MRQPKGTVTVENFRGRLRLRLPRQVFGGEQKRLMLGLPDTPLNRKVAEAKAKEIEADIVLERFDHTLTKYRPPTYHPPADERLDELPPLYELWQQYTDFKSEYLASTTLNKDFKKVANHIANFPSQDLLDAKKIRAYLQSTLTSDAARRVLQQLRACCAWATEEEIIPLNPFEGLKIRTRRGNKRDINPFTKEERDTIISAFEQSQQYSYYTPFVKFLFLTGCRTSEAIGLRWEHIDKALSTITFTEAVVEGDRKELKTYKPRRFPINAQLREVLLSVRPNETLLAMPVFPAKEGGLIDAHNFLNRAWKGVFSQLIGIPYRPQYNTRHSFITYCLESGVPVAQVAAWVGNSPKTIWSHYAGIVNLIEVPNI